MTLRNQPMALSLYRQVCVCWAGMRLDPPAPELALLTACLLMVPSSVSIRS